VLSVLSVLSSLSVVATAATSWFPPYAVGSRAGTAAVPTNVSPAESGSRSPPEDVRGILTLVAQERGTTEGFDVKVSGTDDPTEIARLAEAGATWWGRWIEPGDPGRVREIIMSGPPRV
jgi:hypothetical protein